MCYPPWVGWGGRMTSTTRRDRAKMTWPLLTVGGGAVVLIPIRFSGVTLASMSMKKRFFFPFDF